MSSVQPRHTVLVVEDEPLVRMYAADVLECAGYCVIEASNAPDALEKLEERPDVGVVFSDVNMPGSLDGFDLAREVFRRRPSIRMILTSGKMYPDSGITAIIRAFIPKPYSAENLTGMIGKVCAAA